MQVNQLFISIYVCISKSIFNHLDNDDDDDNDNDTDNDDDDDDNDDDDDDDDDDRCPDRDDFADMSCGGNSNCVTRPSDGEGCWVCMADCNTGQYTANH